MAKAFDFTHEDSCEHAIGFADRDEPLSEDELWEWARRAPFMASENGLGEVSLVRREPEAPEATGSAVFVYPLMTARVRRVALGWARPKGKR